MFTYVQTYCMGLPHPSEKFDQIGEYTSKKYKIRLFFLFLFLSPPHAFIKMTVYGRNAAPPTPRVERLRLTQARLYPGRSTHVQARTRRPSFALPGLIFVS